LETANFFQKTLDKHKSMCYNKYTKEREVHTMTKRKRDKRERKMTPEQLEQLMIMRRRGWVQKNGKAYNRKQKHKGAKDND
jgi:hypothetical protein